MMFSGVFDVAMVVRLGVGQFLRRDQHVSYPFDGGVGKFEPIDMDAVLAARPCARLPTRGEGSRARRVELRGDVPQPAPSLPRIDARGGDRKSGKSTIIEREHSAKLRRPGGDRQAGLGDLLQHLNAFEMSADSVNCAPFQMALGAPV